MLVINVTHEVGVSGAQVDQFVLSFVKILARLINDDLDDLALH